MSDAAAPAVWCSRIVIIGDSLTAQGNGALHATFPNAFVNARGGRVTSEGYEPALGIKESNVADCWVFALGTNDVYFNLAPAVSTAAINKMISLIGPTDHVWWILPQFVTGGTLSGTLNTAAFNALVPSYVVKVALNLPATDFTPDGIHLTEAGYVHRAAAIAAAIAT